MQKRIKMRAKLPKKAQNPFFCAHWQQQASISLYILFSCHFFVCYTLKSLPNQENYIEFSIMIARL